jgi:hypothetical protein
LNENDIVDVKAPSGHFCMSMTKKYPVVLLAGGVGITPLLSMLNAIAEMGSQREVWFFLGVRNKKEHAMKEHLEMVARENENVHLKVFYSAPAETDVLNEDYHVKGRVNVENIKTFLPSGTNVKPFFTILSVDNFDIFSSKKITSPFLEIRFIIPFKVDVFPAPLLPIRVTILPSFTSKLIPLTALITP